MVVQRLFYNMTCHNEVFTWIDFSQVIGLLFHASCYHLGWPKGVPPIQPWQFERLCTADNEYFSIMRMDAGLEQVMCCDVLHWLLYMVYEFLSFYYDIASWGGMHITIEYLSNLGHLYEHLIRAPEILYNDSMPGKISSISHKGLWVWNEETLILWNKVVSISFISWGHLLGPPSHLRDCRRSWVCAVFQR